MGIMNALDVCLVSAAEVMRFFRDFWDVLPFAIHALVYVAFGLFLLVGLIRMVM